MDAPRKDQSSAGHKIEHHVDERYEHYLAEQDAEVSEIVLSPSEGDIMTPLASSHNVTNDDVGAHNHSQQSSFPLLPARTNHDDRTGIRSTPVRSAVQGIPSTEGYFASHQPRSSLSARRVIGAHASSLQSTTGFGHVPSGHENLDTAYLPVRRAMSTKSNPSHSRIRSTSQPKISSRSQPGSKRPSNGDLLVYPDQSLASLQSPVSNPRPHPILRARSSHPAQHHLYNDVSTINKQSITSGVRTADNTPMSSPGLFSPSSIKPVSLNDSRSSSPQLHHLQAPKETHTAEIDHDVYSGNKFINNYEIVGELGRGEHGKVKLGRDMERNHSVVAIKIVPRYSTKRRLGKLGAPEDVTKREVAILKKARHPNVVSLLEVIDDPNKNKVYLILEFVDKGEIKWRKHGVKEILAINNQRFEQERFGVNLSTEPTERDLHIIHIAQARHDRLEQMRRYHQGLINAPNWSLEYAGETDDESDTFDLSRSVSRQFSHVSSPARGNSQDDYSGSINDPPLSGSMYGAYMPEAYRHRKFSIAASAISHMSSEMNFEQDDDQRSYVPALTLEEARRAFQDTLLGLEFLHFIGIIHRDIKPANLLVSSTGSVKISDFGVSYLGRPVTEDEVDKLHESEASTLENDWELARSVGTPAFWSPELCYETTDMFDDKKEPKITGALDLWALGITLYCMIYARLPFYHNETMGIHEAVCTADVFCPKTRLVPVDTTSSEPVSRPFHSINSNKRLDYELRFEYVPETVRDLITKLLIKDPAHRITIAEAKAHPWVTESITNPEGFFHHPELSAERKDKILHASDKEIDRAVVKRNFIEKISSTAGRIVGSLLGRKDTRKRASTTASSAGSSSESLHSPASSTATTVGKIDRARESRRASLRGDELLQALKASRDPSDHHPLAQSQSASPDSTTGSPSLETVSPGYFDHKAKAKAASAGPTPAPNSERQGRPRAPDRAISALSTAESVKTIRASQQHKLSVPEVTSTVDTLSNEQSLRSRVEGLWEGTTKTLNRLASRDRRDTSRSRSQSQPPSENDGHAGPSLAVSNTHAAGAFQTPDALKAVDDKSESPYPASTLYQINTSRPLIKAQSSDQVAFEQAQQMNQRRQIQENLSKTNAGQNQSVSALAIEPCPPSPDDLFSAHRAAHTSVEIPVSAIPTAVSASTIASSVDGYGNSSVSQSISNPSIGVISNSSSPPGDNFLLENPKHQWYSSNMQQPETSSDIMRTAETVTSHGRPTTPTATGKPLQAQTDYYANDCYEDEDEGDSSDEEGIVMGGPKRR